MYYTYSIDGDRILISLAGEVDHHTAKKVREEIDAIIIREKPKVLFLDLSTVGFCDSSGLGLVMGRLKTVNANGGNLVILRPSDAVKKILSIAGLDKIIHIEYENKSEGSIKL